MNTTPAKLGVLAVIAAVFALPTTAAAQSGGQPAPDPNNGGAGEVDPGFQLSSKRSVFKGTGIRIRGSAAGLAGKTVRIEHQVAGAWIGVAAAQAGPDGSFSTVWTPAGAGRYVLRAVAATDGSANTASAKVSVPRTVTVYRSARASWYGPGFYGKRTACGQRLGRNTVGVAHKTLPCGTQVAVTYRGRSLVLPVIDRGPFARGIHWDLTGAAAEKLGVTVTSRIGVVPLGKPD